MPQDYFPAPRPQEDARPFIIRYAARQRAAAAALLRSQRKSSVMGLPCCSAAEAPARWFPPQSPPFPISSSPLWLCCSSRRGSSARRGPSLFGAGIWLSRAACTRPAYGRVCSWRRWRSPPCPASRFCVCPACTWLPMEAWRVSCWSGTSGGGCSWRSSGRSRCSRPCSCPVCCRPTWSGGSCPRRRRTSPWAGSAVSRCWNRSMSCCALLCGSCASSALPPPWPRGLWRLRDAFRGQSRQ